MFFMKMPVSHKKIFNSKQIIFKKITKLKKPKKTYINFFKKNQKTLICKKKL
jgi:hypothetical protein